MQWSKKALGANLRRIRMEMNKTQLDFAYEADLTPNALAKMECGLSTPSTETICKICNAWGIEPNDLFRKEQA